MRLDKTKEVEVELQGERTVGPEGVIVYTGTLPFVLLPTVKDQDGGGASDKVGDWSMPALIHPMLLVFQITLVELYIAKYLRLDFRAICVGLATWPSGKAPLP